MTHISVNKLTIIGSDNGLSPGRRQAIIWTNDGILWIMPYWIYFCEILFQVRKFSLMEMHLKISSVKWRSFCIDVNVLIHILHWLIPDEWPGRTRHTVSKGTNKIKGWYFSDRVITSIFLNFFCICIWVLYLESILTESWCKVPMNKKSAMVQVNKD